MDENVGRILEKLEQDGLIDNTLIIFTGDNGMSMGQHGIFGKGNGTFPLNLYDMAVKVPMIMLILGATGSVKLEEILLSHYDLFTTCDGKDEDVAGNGQIGLCGARSEGKLLLEHRKYQEI